MPLPAEVDLITAIIIWVVFLLFSGVVHEFCHALAAHRQGDPTPSHQGRVTLNPIPHIDPIWTIILPGVLLLASNGTFAFGGAKPVSMNPMHFRDPEKGFMWAAAVGPLSNFALAGLVLLAAVIYVPENAMILYAMQVFYFVNILLGVFNMIPVPPLDGSRILRYLLPPEYKQVMDTLEQYGIIIIFGGLILLRILNIPLLAYLFGIFLLPAMWVGLL